MSAGKNWGVNLGLDFGHSGDLRTEYQIPPGLGFAPAEVAPRQARGLGLVTAPPTIRLAKPPSWSSGPRPCIPIGRRGRAEWVLWDRDWDTSDDEKAKNLCAMCPARLECLEDALAKEGTVTAQYRHMVRGGVTPRGRWRLHRKRKREEKKRKDQELTNQEKTA